MSLAQDIIKFIETLPIGDHPDGKKYKLLPFQKRFLRGTFSPKCSRSGLSIARGNGKSGTCSALILCMILPEGPLHEKNLDVACFAASFNQSRIVADSVRGSLREMKREKEYRISDSDNQVRFIHKISNCRFRAYASDSQKSHGGKWKYIVCDELAQWGPSGAKLWSSIVTSQGKRKGGKIIAIGTKPVDTEHYFSRLLNDKAASTYSQVHDSDPAKHDWRKRETWLLANPALGVLLEEKILVEAAARAKTDTGERASFKAYRCNQGTFDTDSIEFLIEPEAWTRIESEQTSPEGSYTLGLDLGGGTSFTAAIAVFENFHISIVQAIGDDPPLKEREQIDDVPAGTYERMEREEELLLIGTNAVPIAGFLEALEDRWGLLPRVIVSDRYKRNELIADLKKVGWYGKVGLIFRSATYEQSSEDLSLFRRAVLDREIVAPKSWAFVNALSGARVQKSDQGHEKMRKKGGGRRHRHKDDLCAAAVLGIAEAMRKKNRVVVTHPLEIASTAIAPQEGQEIAGF